LAFPKPCRLKLALFIAKRIAFNRQYSFSRFIIRLSVTATALSVMAMIITLAFVNGFQQAISEKVFSFWGHVRVQQYEPGRSLLAEESVITRNDTVETLLRSQSGIESVQHFATKSAVLEYRKQIEGVLIKAVDKAYDSSRLSRYINGGRWLQFDDSLYSKDLLLSSPLASRLNVQVNDTVTVYFISPIDGSRTYRRLRVCGLYKTGIEEYDKLFILADLRLVQRLNGWTTQQTGSYELFLKDFSRMDSISNSLNEQLPLSWGSRSIREVYPNIFDWLNIQNMNRNVIFIVMAVVAIINLVTCLLILILERTRMVGILKALGAEEKLIRQIFLYHASVITIRGVGIGLLAGLGLCWLQQYTGFIHLDESSYYVKTAPVQLIGWQVALVVIATTVVCYLSLIIPTWLVRRMQPVKAIQFR
jgi:lipoprotein-releasing system permease protein